MDPKLADLFEKKKESGAGDAVDWNERCQKYVAAVQNLYQQIEMMLAEPIRQNTVVLRRHSKSL
ncbi:MAG TPA: hypothetical protein VGZ26_12520, partial [Pirellulales bacterium]|nr:hypothetical protein [Pirellulales bacterium]